MVGNGCTDYKFDNGNQMFDMSFWYGILPSEVYFGWQSNNCSLLNDTLSPICK